MRDVTIQVVKSDDGYRVVVVDDAKSDSNSAGTKSNISDLKSSTKEQMISMVNEILGKIE